MGFFVLENHMDKKINALNINARGPIQVTFIESDGAEPEVVIQQVNPWAGDLCESVSLTYGEFAAIVRAVTRHRESDEAFCEAWDRSYEG